MHQLWRHPNSIWYVLHGPRLKRRISTGQKDRREAEAFLAQFIAGSREPSLPSTTVRAILEGYRDDHGKGLRGQSGLIYGVKALIAQIGDLGPDHLTPTVMKRYAAERGASNGTVLREVGILRAALAWAKNHNLITSKPEIPNPVPTPAPRERWLTKEEARRLLAGCTEPHVKLFVHLGLMTAARSGAILEARWSQVDLKAKRIDYGRGHGNKRRTVVTLNPEVLSLLAAASQLACSDYVVEFRGKRVTTVKTGFAAACRRSGLEGVTPHILRHTAATWAVMEGRPLDEVARMLGDSVASVERVYAKWAPEHLKDTVAALQLGETKKPRALQPKGNGVRIRSNQGNKGRTARV